MSAAAENKEEKKLLLKGVKFKLIVGLASVPKRKFSACFVLVVIFYDIIIVGNKLFIQYWCGGEQEEV